jgi:hypothetical protein
MSKNNSTDKGDKITKEVMDKLREQSKKRGITIDTIISDFLDKSKDREKENTHKGTKTKSEKASKTVDVTADLSKLLPQNNPDFIEILRRIAESMENIEREHAQGWSDQRKDLQAISKRMDKLL